MDQYLQRKKEIFDNNVTYSAKELLSEVKKSCTTYKELKDQLSEVRNQQIVKSHWAGKDNDGFILIIDKSIELLDEEIGAIVISKDTDM